MDSMRPQLVRIGGFMATAGLLSIALQAIGFELRILMWIDLMGPEIGWAIRFGLVIVGAALFAIGRFTAAPSKAAG